VAGHPTPERPVNELREVLDNLDPSARDSLKRVLIRDRTDRMGSRGTSSATETRRGRAGLGRCDWPLTINDDAWKRVVQLLGELEVEG